MIRLFYRLLFPLVFVLLLPGYLRRMIRRGNFRRDASQRWARYEPALQQRFRDGDWIWVHAVSVGELLIARKLLVEVHRRHPQLRVVLSSTTSTAHTMALEEGAEWITPVYTPLDFARIARRALATVQPRMIVLVEGDAWPNFVWTATDRGIPVALVNARMSPRSRRRYLRWARPASALFRHLSAVCLQEAEHRPVWEALGVAFDRIHQCGSIKFDPAAVEEAPRDFRPVLHRAGIEAGDPVLLGGSTHEGEEVMLAEVLAELRPRFPGLRLLLAPRHVERTPHILEALAATPWKVALRSPEPSGPPPDILLLNTTGELRDWFACADVVFIGKSLAGGGGQNPVEAILAGCPVVCGPRMENFAELHAALLAAGGVAEVADAKGLADRVAGLLDRPEDRSSMVAAAREVLTQHRHATQRTADVLDRLLVHSESHRTNR